jgi:hypothetical protein
MCLFLCAHNFLFDDDDGDDTRETDSVLVYTFHEASKREVQKLIVCDCSLIPTSLSSIEMLQMRSITQVLYYPKHKIDSCFIIPSSLSHTHFRCRYRVKINLFSPLLLRQSKEHTFSYLYLFLRLFCVCYTYCGGARERFVNFHNKSFFLSSSYRKINFY